MKLLAEDDSIHKAVGDYSEVRSDAEFKWLSLQAADKNFMEVRGEKLLEIQLRGENKMLFICEMLRVAL